MLGYSTPLQEIQADTQREGILGEVSLVPCFESFM